MNSLGAVPSPELFDTASGFAPRLSAETALPPLSFNAAGLLASRGDRLAGAASPPLPSPQQAGLYLLWPLLFMVVGS